jgi:hypothetical protein
MSFSQNKWVLEKDANQVKVYTRLVKSSNFKEYKATVLVETSINKLVNFITDGNKLKDWNYRTTKSSLIEKISDSIFFVYMYNDLPWPAKNRDHISRLKIEMLSSSFVKIHIKSFPDKLNNVKGVVRVNNFDGFWLLQKTNLGIQVTQQLHGDPGGYLPYFIVNSKIAEAPFVSLRNLQKHFERR